MTKHTFLPSVVFEIKRSLESPRRVIGLIWNQSEGQHNINNFRACESKTRLVQKFNLWKKYQEYMRVIESAKKKIQIEVISELRENIFWDWLTWTTLILLLRWSAPTNTVNSGPTASFLLIKVIYFNMSQDFSFQSSEVTVQDPYSFIRSCKGCEPLLLISSVFTHDL